MKDLIELRSALKKAEQEYKTAHTSLEGSLALVLAKEELKIARFLFDKACRRYTLEHFFEEPQLDEQD